MIMNNDNAALEQSLDLFPLLTVEATPLGHEDNRNCKRFDFICVRTFNKKRIFAFL